MVWGVCRHALRSESDAEDAFQATFLTLVRSASRIKKRDSLGAWLHGVALRVCLKSRQTTARRLVRETKAAKRSEADQQTESWHNDIVAVHACINQLPSREHAVFVLAVLEGMSQPDVARQLGLQVNSVSGLLSRARRRLQRQLKSTETLSMLALTVAISAQAAIPSTLFTQTCGLALSTSGLSVPVLALSASLMEITMRKYLLMGLLSLFLCSGVTVGTFLLNTTDAQESRTNTHNEAREKQDRRAVQGYPLAATAIPATKWEYKTLRLNDTKNNDGELNAMGEQGWELCSVQSAMSANSTLASYTFKRPKQTTFAGYPLKGQEASTNTALGFLQAQRAYQKEVTGMPLIGTEPAPKQNKESSSSDYHVYRLKKADATKVAEVLRSAYHTVQVVSDPQTNSIHVQGGDAKSWSEIIKKLDDNDSTSERKAK